MLNAAATVDTEPFYAICDWDWCSRFLVTPSRTPLRRRACLREVSVTDASPDACRNIPGDDSFKQCRERQIIANSEARRLRASSSSQRSTNPGTSRLQLRVRPRVEAENRVLRQDLEEAEQQT